MPDVLAISGACTARGGAAVVERALTGATLALHARGGRAVVERELEASGGAVRARAGVAVVERLLLARGGHAVVIAARARIDNLTATSGHIRVGSGGGRLLVDRATAQTAVAAPAVTRPRREVRFLAQRILDRRWLSWNVGLGAPRIGWKINGATEIAGTIAARELYDAGMDEWATWLHAERDGQIVASAALAPFSPGGADISVSAAGFTRYAHGTPYEGDFKLGNPVGQQIDPLDVVRTIWAHLQSYPDGRLGVQVATTKSPRRIGTAEQNVAFTTGAGQNVAFTSGPYLLPWWADTDCGREVDELAVETPFDYREASRWNADRTDVVQNLELGYPRLGRDQPDLAFAEGQNLTEALTPVEDDDNYASEVIVLGSGEGTARVRGRYGAVVGRRVRRVVKLEDKTITSTARADSKARDEWMRRRGQLSFQRVSLKARHPNAALGSFAVGDDIPVRARVAGIGRVDIRHRVTALDWDVDASSLVATCARSDTFTYQPPVSA